MNLFSLFAALLIFTQASVPVPRQTPNGAAHAHSKPEDKAYRGNTSPASALAIAVPKKDDTPDLKTNGNESANAHPPQVDVDVVKMPRRDRFDWITWGGGILLTIVGIVGVVVAVCTLKKIETQTEIQRAAYKQWVELVDWKSQVLADGRFEISFSLLNPTNFLIVLICADVRFKPELPEMYSLVRTGTPLPPKTPITFKLHPPISEPGLQTFRTGQQMGIVIEGRIGFWSALEEVITQEFSGPILCSLSGTTLESTMTLKTTKDKDAKEKRKNWAFGP
jgi:hypothetical protein